jgi:NitT/TauT family transport system substrate-binding protein
LADPIKRRSIVAFVRAAAQATAALKDNPEAYWQHVSSITGFTTEEISWGWPEMEFPVRIVPDMLDVLEVEDVWVAQERKRAPRSREELARFIDASVVAEALASD